jgi:putative hydrolase of the HAD superfamily
MMRLSPSELSAPLPVWFYDADRPQLPAVDRRGRWRGSRGMILDLDDTLYPLHRYRQSGYAAVASYCATRFDVLASEVFTLLSRCAGAGQGQTAFQTLCQRFGLNVETVPVLLEVYRAHKPTIVLSHGAFDMLRTLRGDGWRLAVLTNGLPSVQSRKVTALGLDALVDHVVFAEEVAPGGKPAPAAFAEAVRCLGTRVDRTVCVGDDLRCDIVGARTAGLATIRLASNGLTATAIDADIVVQSLSDVPRAAVSLLEGVTRHAA